MDNINVILNSNDVSEYLKISPNGLEVKSSFARPQIPTVLFTLHVQAGIERTSKSNTQDIIRNVPIFLFLREIFFSASALLRCIVQCQQQILNGGAFRVTWSCSVSPPRPNVIFKPDFVSRVSPVRQGLKLQHQCDSKGTVCCRTFVLGSCSSGRKRWKKYTWLNLGKPWLSSFNFSAIAVISFFCLLRH
jgi:hypothetical protein